MLGDLELNWHGSLFCDSDGETRGLISIGGPQKHGRRLRSSNLLENVATGLAFPPSSQKRCGSGPGWRVFLLSVCDMNSLE